jgi:hypothetical protein
METQEIPRPERGTVTLTVEEKRAVRAVALLRGMDESSLLRTKVVADIVAEYERSREALDAA